jgi:hypothetical protein
MRPARRAALTWRWGPQRIEKAPAARARREAAERERLGCLVTDEQSRWATFNALLDELGKTVEVKR